VTMTSGTGTCSLTANWAADNNYLAASASQSTSATKANSVTTITSNSPNPSGIGQPVTVNFTATGTGVPTGSVSVTASTGESCNSALNLGAGSCTLTFATSGSRTLTASYGGDGNFNGSVSASVSQTVSSPQIMLSPASLNFGSVARGKKVSLTETVSNPGNATLNISKVSITLGYADWDDFTFTNKCGGTLTAGASCSIVVTFYADDSGTRTATLVITDNAAGSPQSVPLTGTVKNH